MKLAGWELQLAIDNRLYNDTTIINMVQGIYDDVPEITPFPYISYGPETTNWWGTKTTDGEDMTFQLDVWSQKRGSKEVKDIMNAVIQSITASPLSLGNGFFIVIQSDMFTQVLDDPDGKTKHGVIRFRFRISQ